jgi:hypothetical protein
MSYPRKKKTKARKDLLLKITLAPYVHRRLMRASLSTGGFSHELRDLVELLEERNQGR